MFKKIFPALIALLLLAPTLAAGPARAAAGQAEQSVVELFNMQSSVLDAALELSMEEPTPGKDPFKASLDRFDAHAAKFKKLAGVGRPGQDKLTRYVKKLEARRSQVEAIIDDLKKQAARGRVDPIFIRGLDIAFNRLNYALKRTMQHLVNDLADKKSQGKAKVGSALMVMIMSADLSEAVRAANARANRGGGMPEEVAFWNTMADFDLMAAMHRLSATKPDGKKFLRLIAAKKTILENGEALINSTMPDKTLDLKAKEILLKVVDQIRPICAELITETLN